MEDIVMSSPMIQGVLMFGRMRNQTGIIIEPSAGHDVGDNAKASAYVQDIWYVHYVRILNLLTSRANAFRSVVEEANQKAPAFSKIYKEMVLITTPGKSLPRTGKGTVMRKLALQLYQSEIDNMSVCL